MAYSIFNSYDYLDDEKKKKPSQVAAEQQKQSREYSVFSELGKKAETYVEPTRTTVVEPQKLSLFERAKETISKANQKVGELYKGVARAVLPKSFEKALGIEPEQKTGIIPLRQFKAGIGDVIATAGSTATWLGAEGIGTRLSREGSALQSVAVENANEFDWKDVFDPSFYTTRVARSLPFSLALIPAAIVGGYAGAGTAAVVGLGAFGRAVLGSIGAGLLSRPIESALEAGTTYDEMIKSGKSVEEADKAADKTFKGNLALAGADIAEFLLAFAPIKGGKGWMKALKRTAGIAGNIAMEGSEEVIQRNIQLAAKGEPLDISSRQAQEEFAIGGIMGGGLGVAGALFQKIKDRASEEFSDEYTKQYDEHIKNGLSEPEAQLKSLDDIAEKEPQKFEQIIENVIKESVVPVVPTEGGQVSETPKVSPEEIQKVFFANKQDYTSAADLAQGEFGQPVTAQIGFMDPKGIVARDPVDRPAVDQYKADIEEGKVIEPIIVSRQKGVIETTDGTHRLIAYQELNKPVPVIYTGKDQVASLTTFEKAFTQATGGVGGEIPFKDLPISAKGGIQSALREKITNEGASPDLIKNLENTKWIKTEKSISELQKTNPDIFKDTFTKRPIVTQGAIVIDANGVVVDGNNRLRDAFERKDKTIKVFQPTPSIGGEIGKSTGEEKLVIKNNPRNRNFPYQVEYVSHGSKLHRNFTSKESAERWIASKPEATTPSPIEKKPVQGVTEAPVKMIPQEMASELATAISGIKNRTSPVAIKGWGKSQNKNYPITDMPNAYTDGLMVVTDRKPEEVKAWQGQYGDAYRKELTQEQVKNIIPDSLEGQEKLWDPINFILAIRNEPSIALFKFGDGETIGINAEGWKWLKKEGYDLFAKGKESVITLAKKGRIVGAVMPIRLGENQVAERGIIKPYAGTTDKGARGVRVSGQPADIVPEGEAKQAGVGEAVEKRRGEVAPRGREGGDLGVGERLGTRIEDKVPIDVVDEASKDWLDNYSTVYKDEPNKGVRDNLEKAFINKWRQKSIEKVTPVVASKVDQVEVNSDIEILVFEKGTEGYSPEQKALLRQYTGAGGLEKAGAEGRGLLDEYYTPKAIVNFMWDKVLSLTELDKGSQVIEPAAGIGGFLDRVPQDVKKSAHEINETASKIIQVLYPDATVFNEPFENLFISPRGEKYPIQQVADLVIGNPPYGEHRGKYLGLGEEPKIIKYEEYFLKRGLDITKDDGLLAYVIPSGFLRSDISYAKREIAKMGELVDAYRLPGGVFGTTTIGTDIVIFKRGKPEQMQRTLDFMRNDNYFLGNPEKVLGQISKGTGRYGQDEVIGTLEQAIQKAKDTPKVITDSIETTDLVENEKAKSKEVTETIEKTKSKDVPKGRAPQTATTTTDVNSKAIIIPGKQDSRIKLNDVSEEDLQFWKSVRVTGDLGGEYVAKDPKTFESDKVAVVIDEEGTKYYPNVLYYTGNIYSRLDELELFRSKINPKQYEIQKKKLEEVLPLAQTVEKISLQPVSDVVKSITIPVEGKEGQANLIGLFTDYIHSLPWDAFGSSSQWEVQGYVAGSIVNTGDKLQNVEVRKRRRSVGNSLFRRFIQENLTDEQKKSVEEFYNRTFNGYYRPDYRQVPILSEVNATFNPKKKPGKHPLAVKEIQKEGAAFLTTKGAGLLAYDVGVGKTLTSILAINDVLKRGWAKRPLIVVPNGVYRNWINEISEVIPDVKINSLVNLGNAFRGDLKTLKIEEGTLSIITYDGLVKLGFKPETYDGLTGDLQDVMMGVNSTKRGKEKELANIEQQIGRAIRGTTGDRFFEDLGFDHITIDEVHNFKNIFAGAKLERGQGNEYRNVRGSSSNRGIKAYLMAQYVLKNNNNRNVFLLSATPFTNSPMEIYSILSLMGKKRLENLGLKNVNDFMSMFMELKPTFVVKADQSVKEEDVIEKFQNLQQLQKIVTEFIDFRTGEEAGIDRPGRIKRTITLSPTELQADYISKSQELFDKKKGGAIVAITELQNITLSPYLSRYNEKSPTPKEFVENSPKIKYAMEALTQVYKDNKNVGQIVYMPRGVDKFPLIREYLVKEKGFKSDQIGEISGGMSIDARQDMQVKFNSGDIKVLLGSEAIKEGVNLQERSTDLYHLHLPWNPTDMLQVEGRIWRQGNDWANVRVHYPLIENSVDSFIFQKLETKEKRIRNLWSYKENEINLGDLNFEEMKLDLITNPVIRVQAEKTFETKKEG